MIEIPEYNPRCISGSVRDFMIVVGLHITKLGDKNTIKIDDSKFDWEYTADPFELFIKIKNGRRYLKIKMMHPDSIKDLTFSTGII